MEILRRVFSSVASNRAIQWVLGAVATILAIRLRDRRQRKKGRDKAHEGVHEANTDAALGMQRRVDDALRDADGMHDIPDEFYRD